MGKKNKEAPESWDWRGDEFRRDQAKKYGIDMSGYSRFGDQSGARGTPTKSYEDLERAIVAAARNDYDIRRTREAAEMLDMDHGIESGFEDMQDIYDYYDFGKQVHKKDMGNGGKFSSANDFAGVTNYLVNKDREKNIYGPMDAMGDRIDELEEGIVDGVNEDIASEEPYVPSQELTNAVDNTTIYETDALSGVRSAEIFPTIDNEAAALKLSDQYILNLTGAMKPNAKENINNAFAVAFGTK